MNRRREILTRLKSIVIVSFFLIFSTLFIFLPNNREMVGALSFLNRINSINVRGITDEFELAYNFPISDNMGIKTKAYEFEIENTLNSKIKYNVVFQTGKEDDPTRVANCFVKYMLYRDNILIKDVTTLENSGIILTDGIAGASKHKYSLKFWISDDKDCNLFGKTFAAGILVNVIK